MVVYASHDSEGGCCTEEYVEAGLQGLVFLMEQLLIDNTRTRKHLIVINTFTRTLSYSFTI